MTWCFAGPRGVIHRLATLWAEAATVFLRGRHDRAGRPFHGGDRHDRQHRHTTDDRRHILDDRHHIADDRSHILDDRHHTTDDRHQTTDDRRHILDDRPRGIGDHHAHTEPSRA
ncbi:hypothetical protein ABZ354_19435 [Streptomyces sp. NPDC005925]|uniref:hypothetical protein n=1 Tax=Streptomyces sp. NPDC005925 TaxID=3157172 RepID=UPI0033E2608E